MKFLLSLVAAIRAALTASPGFLTKLDPRAMVANVYSAQYAKLNTNPVTKLATDECHGRIRYLIGVYTQGAADGNIGDTVYFGKLPANARLIPHLSKVYFSAGNANATLAVGIPGTTAKFLAATAIAAQGNALLEAFGADGGTYKTGSAGVDVIGTNAVAAIKAAQVITAHLAYVCD